ncbi:MAG: low temperature requirement protein A [Desulfobaccales bacterium]
MRVVEGAEGERHATWLELFYDLLFAAVVAQLTFELSQDFSGIGVLTFVVLCVPFWWAWVGQSFYATRFDTDDLGHRLFIIAPQQVRLDSIWVCGRQETSRKTCSKRKNGARELPCPIGGTSVLSA